MSPFRKLSSIAKSEIFRIKRQQLKRSFPLYPFSFFADVKNGHVSSLGASPRPRSFCSSSDSVSKVVTLFTEKEVPFSRDTRMEELNKAVSELADELVSMGASDSEKITDILNTKGAFLLEADGGHFLVELLIRLRPWPQLGLEVFNWKRRWFDTAGKMMPEEYTKAINLAGRIKNLNLAQNLFSEATGKGIKTTSVYNALMGAYMYNGLIEQSLLLFEDLKKDSQCTPTIVTFNILLSVFGRSMMVKDMEMIVKMIKDCDLTPNRTTYNTLIAGYVTAWMWNDVEKTFRTMQEQSTMPNTYTYLLMLRGYAMSGNLDKMEKTYELIKDHVNEKHYPLIRSMICAYCKSSITDRVEKIETLLKLIPEEEYRPWLNVLLIRLYAQEDLVEGMESNISKALDQNTPIVTLGVMRSIIASYFRCDMLDKLINFVKQAEDAGWRLCRSLYHCKMVMYGSKNRLEEMESVLGEMESFRFCATKKTFLIMYKAYSKWGQKSKVDRVIGSMFKLGFHIPIDAHNS